jgi:hypothetical protein
LLITEQPTADISAFVVAIGLSVLHHKKPDALPPATLRQLPIELKTTALAVPIMQPIRFMKKPAI